MTGIGPAVAATVEKLRWLAGMGIETVIARVDGLEQRRPLEQLARHVVPAAAELSPAEQGERTP
jgi:hypothetical protein